MSYENILLEREDKLAVVTINRPQSLNALNAKTIQEISSAMDELNADPTCRVIIITGSGEKSFVAGADIKEFSDFDRKKPKNWPETGTIPCSTKLKIHLNLLLQPLMVSL